MTEQNIPLPEAKASPLERLARVASAVTTPLYAPILAFVALFTCTSLTIMPIGYKLFIWSMVASFTVVAPGLFILLYQKMNRWKAAELDERQRRFIPYTLVTMSYLTCLIIMHRMHFPHYLSGVMVAALLSVLVCMLLNLRWKVSTHMAACGLWVSGIISFSLMFVFNPVWWLCGFILLSGGVGSARIILGRQTFLEVFIGFVVGMFCGIIGILFI